MKIAVCDNDREICAYIAACISGQEPTATVSVFYRAEDFWRTNEKFAVVFLDIKSIDGLQIARRFPKDRRPVIVFVTGYIREYIEEICDLQPFHLFNAQYRNQKASRICGTHIIFNHIMEPARGLEPPTC